MELYTLEHTTVPFGSTMSMAMIPKSSHKSLWYMLGHFLDGDYSIGFCFPQRCPGLLEVWAPRMVSGRTNQAVSTDPPFSLSSLPSTCHPTLAAGGGHRTRLKICAATLLPGGPFLSWWIAGILVYHLLFLLFHCRLYYLALFMPKQTTN